MKQGGFITIESASNPHNPRNLATDAKIDQLSIPLDTFIEHVLLALQQ